MAFINLCILVEIMPIASQSTLTLNLMYFLNGIIHFPFLALSIIKFREIKIRT